VLRKPESNGTQVRTKLAQLRYHWFTDVVAGWALSALLIQLTFWINRAGRPLDGQPL
jgi:hypothetical protein